MGMSDSEQALFDGKMMPGMFARCKTMAFTIKNIIDSDDFPYRIRSLDDLRNHVLDLVGEEEIVEAWLDKKLKFCDNKTPREMVEASEFKSLERMLFFLNSGS